MVVAVMSVVSAIVIAAVADLETREPLLLRFVVREEPDDEFLRMMRVCKIKQKTREKSKVGVVEVWFDDNIIIRNK